MPTKREEVFWDNIQPIAELFENIFKLKPMCSASLMGFVSMSDKQRLAFLHRAKNISYKEAKKIAQKMKADIDTISAVVGTDEILTEVSIPKIMHETKKGKKKYPRDSVKHG
ncbi:MAG TPA: hypothetical protein HPP87_04670 [Planctomycetes bacterium]|nr:hypothetical protein [Planctomycetota bacterium]